MCDKNPILAQHEHLNLRLDRLRLIALTAPDAIHDSRMRKLLAHEIVELEKELFAHFEFEEKEGYFPDVYRVRPNLAKQLDEIRGQHDALRRETSELTLRCASLALDIPAIKQAFLGLLGRIKAHEQAETQLIGAYLTEDIGVGD